MNGENGACWLPELPRLVERLSALFRTARPIEVLDRRPELSGTFPKEVVTCRLGGGREVSLFCKYSAPRFDAFGHRRGVSYEADVYRQVLSTLPLTLPAYVGSFCDPRDTDAWLVLAELSGAVSSRTDGRRLTNVAAWLGSFHRLTAGASADPRFDFLIRYDAAYYVGWAERVARFAPDVHGDLPWLFDLVGAMPTLAREMTAAPQTMIHGECTVMNVLLVGDDVYPTDWESAAVALGEIDLLCLVDNWPDDVVSACIAAYAVARWPEGEPPDFARHLLLADLYIQLRWLGEHPSWLEVDGATRRLARLEAITSSLRSERTGR